MLVSQMVLTRQCFATTFLLIFWGLFWPGCEVASAQDRNQQPEIPNTQALEIPFTTPQQALAAMTLPDGFRAQLFAHEPDIHQPIAVTTDHRGRLWVVECYTYSDRKQNYDMSLSDRVVILEDTNHDGVHDKRTVFWDQGKKLTGIEVGLGGVWLTAAPQFLFIPDRDHDDVPDGPAEVLLDGFEDNVIRHNIVNGLRWGPDGWLYGRHGIQATSLVGEPGAPPSQRTTMNCSIWRFHPVEKTFEIVAQGGTNPWGFDYDEHGEMYMINTVIGHLFHIVPGARYRRMYGAHFNPYTYQVIEQTADHFHWDTQEEHWAVTKKEGMSPGTDKAGGGHAHTGFMIYQGDNWPAKYHNAQFTSNFHGRRMNMDVARREGNSYVASHGPDFMKTSDPWFRGIESIYGPDGAVYLLDWSDIGECHENDGIHRTSGRIFKISYGTPKQPSVVDLAKLSNQQLVDLLPHRNEWYSRKARRLLQERSIAGDHSMHRLIQAAYTRAGSAPTTVKHRLRFMWALYSTGGANSQWLLQRLEDTNEHIRAWAVRLLTDGRLPIDQVTATRLSVLAKQEHSGLVRLYLASSLWRLKPPNAFHIADSLCQFQQDADDRVQPHLIWFGIEPLVTRDSQQAIGLAMNSKIRLVRENIVRRLFEENERAIVNQLVESIIAPGVDANFRMDMIRGMSKAYEGWAKVTQPVAWETASQALLAQSQASPKLDDKLKKELSSRIQKLNLLFGDGREVTELVKMLTNRSADLNARRRAFEMVSPKLESKKLFEILKQEIRDKSVATQVVKAFVHCNEPGVPGVILNRFKILQPIGQDAAIETLVSRSAWAEKLLASVESGKIPKKKLSAWHARQIRNFKSPKLTEKLASVWGEVRESPADKQAKMNAIRSLVSQGTLAVNSENGKQLFTKHCASCHALFGAGGKIGPDLTGSNRNNLNYLLENMVDPSATVAESYRSSIVQLTDGRLLTGVVVEENTRTLKLQTKDELLAIDLSDIEQRRKTSESLMPEGLLGPLSNQQRVDLIGYIQGIQAK